MATRHLRTAVAAIARFSAFATVLGAVLAIVTKGVFWLFQGAIELLWEWLPGQINAEPTSFAYLAAILGVGGLLVGLGNRFLGYHPEPLEAVTERVKSGEGVDHRTIPQTLANSVASLGFGAPMGPEAALVAVVGGIYFRATNWMESQASVAYQAVTGSTRADTPVGWRYAPSAIVVGALVWTFAASPGGIDLSFVPTTSESSIVAGLPWAVAAGIVFGLLGMITSKVEQRVRSLGVFKTHPEIVATIGGLLIALLATRSFLVLFSGSDSMDVMFGGSVDTAELAVAAGLKWLALMIAFLTGWKGGPIFPLMFIAGALAVAAGDLFGADVVVLYAAGISGAVAGALRSAVLGILVALVVVPTALAVPLIVGASAGTIAVRLLTRATTNPTPT